MNIKDFDIKNFDENKSNLGENYKKIIGLFRDALESNNLESNNLKSNDLTNYIVIVFNNSDFSNYKDSSCFDKSLEKLEKYTYGQTNINANKISNINKIPPSFLRLYKTLDLINNYKLDDGQKKLYILTVYYSALYLVKENKLNNEFLDNAKKYLCEFVKKSKNSLETQLKDNILNDGNLGKKVELFNRIASIKLTIMIAVAIVLIILLNYLYVDSCKQKRKELILVSNSF